MATQAEEVVDLASLSAEELARIEAQVEARMRAAGVRFATENWDTRNRPLVRQRPRWLAFLVRTFRLDRD